MSAIRRRLPWAVAIVLFLGYSLHWVDISSLQATPYWNTIFASGLAMSLVFLSFVIVTGIGGMVSLAQATFVSASGMFMGWLVNHRVPIAIPVLVPNGHVNLIVAMALGVAVACVVGILIAFPVRRLNAVPIALATLALAFVADQGVFIINAVNNTTQGWPIPQPVVDIPVIDQINHFVVRGSRGTIDLGNAQEQVILLLCVFGVITLAIRNVLRSASGRAMFAVRSSETAARSFGVSPSTSKIMLFGLSAAVAGLGGAMLGLVNGSFGATMRPAADGILWLAIAVIFGIRRPGGALLAGVAFTGFYQILTLIGGHLGTFGQQVIASPYFGTALFGIGAIQLAKNPDGLLANAGEQRRERRRQRLERSSVGQAPEVHFDRSSDRVIPTIQVVQMSECPTEDGNTRSGQRIVPAGLAFESIVAGYGDVEVLHGVSLEVYPGTVTALLGLMAQESRPLRVLVRD